MFLISIIFISFHQNILEKRSNRSFHSIIILLKNHIFQKMVWKELEGREGTETYSRRVQSTPPTIFIHRSLSIISFFCLSSVSILLFVSTSGFVLTNFYFFVQSYFSSFNIDLFTDKKYVFFPGFSICFLYTAPPLYLD